MSGHTPGPWVIGELSAPYRLIEHDGVEIVAVDEDWGRGEDGKAVREANARLIVRAVNAYDAHRRVVEAASVVCRLLETEVRVRRSELEALREALAALEENDG